MTQLAEKISPLTHFTKLERHVDGNRFPAWLDKLKRNALARFELVGFPATKSEAWRHTNLSPIVKTKWELADADSAADVGPLVEQFTFGREAVVELADTGAWAVIIEGGAADIEQTLTVGQ